jgi:hypothetical protein
MMVKKKDEPIARKETAAGAGWRRGLGPGAATLAGLALLVTLLPAAPFYARSEASLDYLFAARAGAAAGGAAVLPLYPMLIAAAAKVGADPEAAATWIAILAAALMTLPVYGIGRRLGGVSAGVLGALALAFLPLTIPVGLEINALPLAGLFTAASLWATLAWFDRPSPWRAATAGGFAGLAATSPSQGAVSLLALVLAATAAAVILRWPRRTQLTIGAALGAMLLILLVAGGVGGGKGGGGDLAGTSEEVDPASISPMPLPARIVAYTRETARGLPWPFLGLALIGVVARRREERRDIAGEAAVWLFILGSAFGYPRGTARMANAEVLWPAAALISVWAGQAAVLPGTLRRKLGGRRGWATGAAVVVMIVGALGWELREQGLEQNKALLLLKPEDLKTRLIGGQRELGRDAARALRPKAGARVLGLTPFFAYYFGGEAAAVASPAEAESALQAGRVDYLAIDSLAVQRLAPGLRPLITATGPIGGAGLVYRRYLIDSDRLVSVYQRGAPTLSAAPEDPRPEQAPALLEQAQRYYKDGYIEHARQLLLAVERTSPDEAQPHFELYRVHLIYGSYDLMSLDLAEAELMKYSYLAPHDPNLNLYRDMIRNARMRHVVDWGKE